MYWLSIDPATKTGLASWHGSELQAVATLEPIATLKRATALGSVKGGLELRVLSVPDGVRSGAAFATPCDAWTHLLRHLDAVVIEEAMGRFPKAVAQLAARRGYIHALCDRQSTPYHEINTKEWQRVAGEIIDKSWPNNTEKGKQLSIDLAREHYAGLQVSNDEGDAIWLGRAALRMWTVRP